MESREDLKSILPFLPLGLSYSTLFWPSQVVETLKSMAAGPDQSGVNSGEALFLCISDIRQSLSLANQRLASSARHGYALFFDKIMPETESMQWFGEVIPALGNLLLRLPSLLETHYQNADQIASKGSGKSETGLRLFASQVAGTVYLSQELIGALLACAFFCLFPVIDRHVQNLPTINFDYLFAILYDGRSKMQENKIQCIIHYFRRICSSMPVGFVSFERKVLPLDKCAEHFCCPNANFWINSTIPLCQFKVKDSGLIEDQTFGALEVDFANEYLGGGALHSGCVQDQTSGRTFGRAKMLDGLYYFDEYSSSHKITQSFSSISSLSVKEQIILWHRRLGHPNFFYLKNLFPKLFEGVDCSNFHCESCIFAKNHRSTFLPKPYKSSKPFYLIHSDVWGPSKVVTYSGKRWFVTFIDDHTRLSWVYLMKNKSEVQDIFKDFYNMIETQFQTKISILHSDNGTEYFNEHLSVFLKDKGIVHQSTCRDTPQQNGIAERKNRHILDVARAIMFAMHVPKYLWGDAVLTAIYLINRMPTKILSFKTPLDVLKEIFPNTHSHSDLPIKVFGCTTYVHIPSSFRSKLDHRAVKCIFLGYATNKKGYKCFNPHTQKLYVSMDVSFLENQPFFTENYLQGEKPKLEEDNFWDVSIPLPNVVCLDFPSASMPTIETSNSGGELLQKDPTDSNPEFKFYTRRRLNQMNKDWIADSSLIQSDTLRNDSETTAMADNEAIEIVGAERFSNYTGYAFNFRFAGNHVDKQEIDSLGRRKTFITAIDALCSPGMRQYSSQFLLREVNKAFCGFFDQSKYKQYETLFLESEDVTDRNDTSRNNLPVHESTSNTREHCFGKSLTPECLDDKDDIGIATGNWGCGAFGGDPQVKSIIQWLAASQALRPFVSYYTFGIEALQNIEKVSEWILGHKWTVGDLWSMLVEYSSQISKGQTHVGFFDWLLPASSKTNFCCFS